MKGSGPFLLYTTRETFLHASHILLAVQNALAVVHKCVLLPPMTTTFYLGPACRVRCLELEPGNPRIHGILLSLRVPLSEVLNG